MTQTKYTVAQQFEVETNEAWTNITSDRNEEDDVQRYKNKNLVLTFVCGEYVTLGEITHIVTIRQARAIVIPCNDLKSWETEFSTMEEAEMYLDRVRGINC